MRPRDGRGRYVKINSDIFGNKTPPLTKPRDRYTGKKKEEGSTQKSVELKTGLEGTDINRGGLETSQTFKTSPIVEDPNLVDIVDVEKVNALFGNTQNLVISQVESTTIPFRPSLGNSPLQQNPRREHWDFTPSPKRDKLGCTWFENPLTMGDHEGEHNLEEEVEQEAQKETTFGFPILDFARNVNMKNISASSLPTFYGKSTEDIDTFLFEFDILCKIYNYLQEAQKLKLFPTTLKDSALRWFMGLGEYTIRSWDEMKSSFLKKYRDYGGPKYSQNDIFKMQQHEDESLEDFLERFNFVLQKSKYNTLQEDAVRTLFLKGILEKYVEILNLMASGDVSHKSFEEITELCRKYS